ncbi:hypothetical protein [Huintestinicola sp.]
MTVKELCSNYGLKFQTVYKKITHHKDNELAGHITKVKGESFELDDFAVDFLLPTRVKVIQAIEECEGIVRENNDLKDKLYSAETIAEQTDKQLSKALENMTDEQRSQIYNAAVSGLTEEQKKQILQGAVASLTDEQKKQISDPYIDQMMSSDEVTSQLNEAAAAANAAAEQISVLKEQLDSYETFYLGLALNQNFSNSLQM